MNLRIDLVHGWQRAYRWFSIQAAVALVVVSAVRETAQQLVDGVPALEWVAHAHWYPPTMIVLGSLAALLRLVHQPAVAAAAPPATIDPDAETTAASARIAAGLAPIAAHVPTAVPTAVPTDPAALLQAAILNLGIDTTMSPIFRNILARIPQLVIDTEAAFKGTPRIRRRQGRHCHLDRRGRASGRRQRRHGEGPGHHADGRRVLQRHAPAVPEARRVDHHRSVPGPDGVTDGPASARSLARRGIGLPFNLSPSPRSSQSLGARHSASAQAAVVAAQPLQEVAAESNMSLVLHRLLL